MAFIDDIDPRGMVMGVAPAPFLGSYPTRLLVVPGKYVGKPAPEVLRSTDWDKTTEAWEFDLGGLVWKYRRGMLQYAQWAAVYYPFPRNAWDMLSPASHMYVFVNRVVKKGYYSFTKVPKEWQDRWQEMESQFSKARFYSKTPVFSYDEEADLARTLNLLTEKLTPPPEARNPEEPVRPTLDALVATTPRQVVMRRRMPAVQTPRQPRQAEVRVEPVAIRDWARHVAVAQARTDDMIRQQLAADELARRRAADVEIDRVLFPPWGPNEQ